MKTANGFVNASVGDWNVNLVTTFSIGTALNWGNVIYLGGELNLNPNNINGAFDLTKFDRVAAEQLASNRLTPPTRFSDLRQDKVQQVDFSIIKAFRLTEYLKMTYRCEFFKSTKRAIFNPPDLAPTSSTFGSITDRQTPRAASKWPYG